MNEMIFSILLVLIGFFIGTIAIIIVNYLRGISTTSKIDKMLENAKKESERIKRDSILETKEETYRMKTDAEKEIKEKKQEVKETEERLLARENNIDRRDQTLQNREQLLEERENNLIEKQREIQNEQVKIEEIKNQQLETLEQISNVSKQEAKDLILKKIEDMMNLEITGYIKEREAEAKLEVDRTAKSMLVTCMQRYAGDVANEQTVTVVNLPNDEMKGRIIGREGRNIRTIEAVTGVDLIIDDTPEAIVLSSFDPYRREIARLTIESLIKDGRIHPTRIEELYDKVSNEILIKIREYGEEALFELGITKMDPELVELVGKLHFRTSYGQNALQHSIEVANLSGLLAAELGENVVLAKRAGLLHDIGKSIDHEMEGTHVEIGMDLLRRYKESKDVIHAMSTHHGDYEPQTVEAVLVTAADAISAARPGARRETLEAYIKRLEKLEEIANSYDGVDKSYAIQAGREIRIMVKPEKINDEEIHLLARDITKKIEDELEYPGQIKVSIIRETRAVEYAK